MNINLIACIDSSGGIGKDGMMPWPGFSEDLPRFANLTKGCPIIMGRKTREAIGCDLPDRTSIVLTNGEPLGEVCMSGPNALHNAFAYAAGSPEVFVIGGQSVYEQVWPLATTIYLTKIHKDYNCDRFFPTIDKENWKEVSKKFEKNENFSYTFSEYRRFW